MFSTTPIVNSVQSAILLETKAKKFCENFETMDSLRFSFNRMSILPTSNATPRATKMFNACCALALFLAETLGSVASTTYIIKYLKTDLERSLFSLIHLTAYICGSYMMIVGYSRRQDIQYLFNEVEKIGKQCKKY